MIFWLEERDIQKIARSVPDSEKTLEQDSGFRAVMILFHFPVSICLVLFMPWWLLSRPSKCRVSLFKGTFAASLGQANPH